MSPQSFGLNVAGQEQDTDSGLSLIGVGGRHHLVQQVSLEDGQYAEAGEKNCVHELTQLSSNDFKFGGIDFHAEFISHPISFPSIISSMADTRMSSRDWQDSVTTSFSHLPSFTDTYTPSVITTIEPRAFGAEAEYMSRLKRRESSSERVETTRSSVIVPVGVHDPNSRDSSPSPSHPPSISTLLPPHPSQYDFLCSEPLVETMARDSDGCHLTLKTEPELASPYYQPHSPATQHSSSPVLPNFLHFTPDQSVVQKIQQANQPTPKLLHEPIAQPNAIELQTK